MIDEWEIRIVIIGMVAGTFLLKMIADRLSDLLKEIKGLRWQLEEMENRQERHTEYLHRINERGREQESF